MFDLQDELAEGALPQPPWLEYREDEGDDYDHYAYWEELEYGNDDFFDGVMPNEGDPKDEEAGDKRKRVKIVRDTMAEKRRKIETLSQQPTVLWIPINEALSLDEDCPVQTKSVGPYALLGDWRKRFSGANGLATATFTGDGPDAELPAELPDLEENAEDWEEASGSDDDDDDDELMDTHGDAIDPELIKSALAANLSGAGFAGSDQAALMQTLMQMLSGEGGGNQDEMLEGLTKTLLDQAVEGGPGSAFSQFLSQRGVQLDDEGDEGDEEDEINDEEEEKEGDVIASLPLNAASSLETSEHGMATKNAVPERSTLKKAPQSSAVAGTKRKKVSFEPSEETAEPETKDAPEPDLPDRKRPKREIKAAGPAKAALKNENAHIKNGDMETEPKQTRKRKAAAESEVVAEKTKKQARNFAAPTASSKTKAVEPAPKPTAAKKAVETTVKTTRSGKQRK